MSNFHVSVLLNEAVHLLHVMPGKLYIDATLGGGGHSLEIVRRGGVVLGIDVDDDALNFVKERFKSQNLKIKLAQGNFKDIDQIAKQNGFEKVGGIIFDLGVSSYQLDRPERGFSFRGEGPLDMRMDKSLSVTASDLINGLTKGELNELFTKFGEEPFARRISEAIISARSLKRIENTKELEKIVRSAIKFKHEKINPATRVFQALRIAINDELNSLKEALPKAVSLLEGNGRVAVISFHSLEDRIVKTEFIEFEEQNLGKIVTSKPIVPTDEEIEANSRARSAKLRVFEKI